MSFLHEVIEREGEVLDALHSEEDGLHLEIRRTGAEMVSLRKQCPEGTDRSFLYRDGQIGEPKSGWGNHATVMGYYLHRLWKERSTYRGHEIRGGNHGFLRNFAFGEPEVSREKQSLTYRVAADDVPKSAYPYLVSLALSYSILPGSAVEVRFVFHNDEPELDTHVSFGLHPGFAVRDPRSAVVELPPGTYIRHIAPENFLNGETIEIQHAGGPMPFPAEELPGSFLLELSKVPERRFSLLDPESGNFVELDFSEVPFLTLWSDLSGFVCLEPCWGLPDSNPPTAFEDKPGIQIIPPGGSLNKAFQIRPTCQKS